MTRRRNDDDDQDDQDTDQVDDQVQDDDETTDPVLDPDTLQAGLVDVGSLPGMSGSVISNPLAEFPAQTVRAWLGDRRTKSPAEAAAARSVVAWAESFGVDLGPVNPPKTTS
jgi:hypothetical protein